MKYPQLVSMPSAVSDWLEEQLEARGIDAVVYTRYVLSLLYRDPIDVICPDQDLHFTQPNKEVRRSGGRKRPRRSSGWWGYNLADADRLKRSAAVECLMSASDQKCGIESLVDELWEKLKVINESSADTTETLTETTNRQTASLPEDPAHRYYAAFPPLDSRRANSSPALVDLIPKWLAVSSPKKRLFGRKHQGYEEKLHQKIETDNMKARNSTGGGKQRFNNYFTRGKKMDHPRNNSNNNKREARENPWGEQLFLFNNNNNNNNKISSEMSWSRPEDIINFINENEEESIGGGGDTTPNMYEDLPVDISELLNSPSPIGLDENVEMINLANVREAGTRTIVRYCADATNSIWSAVEENALNADLDLKFSSITIDATAEENETNAYFESYGVDCDYRVWTTSQDLDAFQKWSEDDSADDDALRTSLTLLNHSKKSFFAEVIPGPSPKTPKSASIKPLTDAEGGESKDESVEEDLLHSARSHFKPIGDYKAERAKNNNNNGTLYADGTTFAIPSGVEKIDYKRSESGFLYLLGEDAQNKRRYLDFKRSGSEFALRFNIRQNDKASQTESSDTGEFAIVPEDDSFYFLGDRESLTNEESLMDDVIEEIRNGGCDRCNANNNDSSWQPSQVWGNNRRCPDKKLDRQSIRDIWSVGGDCTCAVCADAPNPIRSKLREDISQDGEQLLSDLRSIQKSYMEELPVAAEIARDISELIGMKERKRRHSSINNEEAREETRFSFEDCLMKIATVPTLRSVTL